MSDLFVSAIVQLEEQKAWDSQISETRNSGWRQLGKRWRRDSGRWTRVVRRVSAYALEYPLSCIDRFFYFTFRTQTFHPVGRFQKSACGVAPFVNMTEGQPAHATSKQQHSRLPSL